MAVFHDSTTWAFQIPGLISCIFTLFMIVSFLTFSDLRTLRYMELVFYASCACFLASLSISIGNPDFSTFACWFQALGINFGFLSSIFWSAVITYQVWLVVTSRSIIEKTLIFHIFCWGLPLILTLIPLSNQSVGIEDDLSICSYIGTSGQPSWELPFWNIFSFFAWIWISFIVMIVFVALVFNHLSKMSFIPAVIKQTTTKLGFYPLIVIFCWTLSTVSVLYAKINPSVSSSKLRLVIEIGTLLSNLQGTLYSIVFFSMNPIVLDKWKYLILFNLFNIKGDIRPNNSTHRIDSYEDTQRTNNSSSLFENVQSFDASQEFDYIPRISTSGSANSGRVPSNNSFQSKRSYFSDILKNPNVIYMDNPILSDQSL